MDGNSVFIVTAAAVALAGLLDRLILQRGKVSDVTVEPAASEGGFRRYVLHYHASSEPDWSEIAYSFRDRKRPTTVITGRTRSMAGCNPGSNDEYLCIREDLLTPGPWELTVRITTTCRRNPFYSLLPLKASKTIQVQIP
ncbi:hypothetical protein [Aeromonas dhakensis]|uniref:hypothetical protein n=1 Tax=Aeromonas dhakensis TaxID=196024 RepID=UPI0024475C5A|nr:hypothetical protein [Aeromonas dhakensis]MDH0348160.1 hypothetical protein [Aeromonas dhakensis]